MGRRRRGDRGQRRADHADLRDHRHRDVAARQLGLPRAAVPDHARSVRPTCTTVSSASPGFVDFVRARSEGVRHPRIDRRARVGRHPGLRRDASRCATRDRSPRRRPAPSAAPTGSAGRLTVQRRQSQLTIAAVAFVLGLLVVVQLRSQAGDPGLAQLSAQDLTVLVANLNDAQRPAPPETRLARSRAGDARPEPVARRRLRRRDLGRPRARPGVCGARSGRRTRGDDLHQRADRRPGRRGAHQRAAQRRRRGHRGGRRAGRDRRRRGRRRRVGPRSTALASAIRSKSRPSERRTSSTGSLTRSGGIIAQLAATQPDVVVTVTPVDRLELAGDDALARSSPWSPTALIP